MSDPTRVLVCDDEEQILRALRVILRDAGYEAHTGPVFEGDQIRSGVAIEGLMPLRGGGGLVELRAIAHAQREDGAHQVLDWRLVGVAA